MITSITPTPTAAYESGLITSTVCTTPTSVAAALITSLGACLIISLVTTWGSGSFPGVRARLQHYLKKFIRIVPHGSMI